MTLQLDMQIAIDTPGLPPQSLIQRWISATLQGRSEDIELTVRIVDEAESASLNEAYRHKQGPTNVLSFPFEAPPGVEEEVTLLGDVVICAPVVLREAVIQHKPAEAHWAHMVVHGVLHLLDYDHQDEDNAMAMESLESRILDNLGYPDPYGN